MTMRVFNVRTGFATNSSSTHSIVYMRGMKLPEQAPEYGFGWDRFTLVERQSKLDYLAALVFDQLRSDVGDVIATHISNQLVGAQRAPDDDRTVDHQSMIVLPRDWNGKGLDLAFLADFKAFLERDDVAILGGNDNTDERHPGLMDDRVIDTKHTQALPIEYPRDGLVARKDPRGYWTLFNRENGAKFRVAFGADSLAHAPEKSTAPEPVDIKLTDYCNIGCSFCYQDSTKAGEHADHDVIRKLTWALRDLRVFEVALGGGEPTTHPHFNSIVDSFAWGGVVPNFTTRNLAWLCAPLLSDAIIEKCGAFAFSANTATEVSQLCTALESRPNVKEKLTIQHIVGLDEEPWAFQNLLSVCAQAQVPVTLLGYKAVGRGKKIGEKPAPKWLKAVKQVTKEQHLRIGIDTALADKWWQPLLDAGVPAWTLTRKEGKFSCYFDAVTQKLYPSSYEEHPGVKLKQLDAEHITAAYAEF